MPSTAKNTSLNYNPFGSAIDSRAFACGGYRYRFSGKEKDNEIKGSGNSYDFGARIYDPRIGRWLSLDPLASKYPYASPYNYVLNRPIDAIDPDGREVYILYNKSTKQLMVIDLDHYGKDLPIKKVNAKDYKLSGIRDKNGNLTHNQVLVIDNVFSGGEADADGNIVRDPNNPKQKPIPNESYDLLEYEGNSEWYKLDAIDDDRYDDEYDSETERNSDGEKRSGFRLHLGGLSYGCVTVCKGEGRSEEYDVLQSILENTSTTQVPKREGMQKYIPGTTRTKYGTMKVLGEDNIPDKKTD